LGREEGVAPYLVCIFDEAIDYRRWDYETLGLEEQIWYLQYLSKLEIVNKIKLDYGTAIVCEVRDADAYLEIWGMASDDLNIALFTLSGNEKFETIKSFVQEYTFSLNQLSHIEHWVYTQCYGKSSDQHHALFYSKNSLDIDRINKMIEDENRMGRK